MLLVVVLALCALVGATNPNGTEDIDLKKAPELFEQFIKDFKRVYKDQKDREIHFEAFKKNLEEINDSNRKSPNAVSAKFGINEFSDYTEEEKRKRLFGLKVNGTTSAP